MKRKYMTPTFLSIALDAEEIMVGSKLEYTYTKANPDEEILTRHQKTIWDCWTD